MGEDKTKLDMSKTLFFNGSTSDGYRFTTAGLQEEGSEEMKIALTVCSKSDTFVKAIGREYVSERIVKENNLLAEPYKLCLENKIVVKVSPKKRGRKFVELCSDFQSLKRNTLFTLFHYSTKK